MRASGFSFRFTPAELKYLWFRRKICPYCLGKLKKRRIVRVVNGKYVEYVNAKFFRDNQLVNCYTYEFDCEKCEHVFSLSTLVNWNWSP